MDVIRVVRRKERLLIARVLHDEISQMVAATRSVLADLIGTSSPSQGSLEAAFDLVDQTHSVIRRQTEAMFGDPVDVWEMLFRARARTMQIEKRTGMATSCKITGDFDDFELVNDSVAAAVDWVVEESLRNCEIHSSATFAELRIEVDGPMLSFELRDDGRGMAPNRTGMGIRIMRENIERLNGELSILATEVDGSGGTIVRARIPLVG